MRNAESKGDLIANPNASAEQLLKTIELQLATQRGYRGKSEHRTAFRIWSLAIIVALTLAAICALQWFAAQLPTKSTFSDFTETK